MKQMTPGEMTAAYVLLKERRIKELSKMSNEDKMLLCDIGVYNDTIAGYMIAALRNSGYGESDIQGAVIALQKAFDDYNAEEATEIYHKWLPWSD